MRARRTWPRWIVGAAVAVTAFLAYTRRVDTGDREPAPPALSIQGELPGGDASAGPAPAPSSPSVPAPASDSVPVPVSVPEDAAGDPGTALKVFVASRARTATPEREAALRLLPAIEARAAERARAARAAGAASEERSALTAAYLACAGAARRAGYRSRLDEIVARHVLCPRPDGESVVHVVRPGESLGRIAARYDFPIEGIQLVNRLRSTTLHVGRKLKVPRGPVEAVVVKSDFRLLVLLGGRYLREYPIGIGRDGSTPEAAFTIAEKIKEPVWHSREGVFPFGHPKNILGTRWLGFSDTPEHQGFGIHGTSLPDSIGREESSGCVRMRNADVEEMFGLVPKGAKVTVVR